jgi:hypothetical protein
MTVTVVSLVTVVTGGTDDSGEFGYMVTVVSLVTVVTGDTDDSGGSGEFGYCGNR